MKYHKQTSFYDPLNNKRGNCLQTAIACLLDLELEEVPAFHLFFWDEKDDLILQKGCRELYYGEEYQNRMYSLACSFWHKTEELFLLSKGIRIDQYYDKEDTVEEMKITNWLKNNPNTVYSASGNSSRGCKHIVLFMNGEMIHDPHPSNEGLLSIDYYQVYTKIINA